MYLQPEPAISVREEPEEHRDDAHSLMHAYIHATSHADATKLRKIDDRHTAPLAYHTYDSSSTHSFTFTRMILHCCDSQFNKIIHVGDVFDMTV